MILPDASLGVLGGGQLGRMFTLAAHSMGYRIVVLDPDPHSPAGLIANQHIKADYRDRAALRILGDECAAITTEFENIPADSLEFLEQYCPVRPGAAAVRIAQNRILEKTFIQEHGLATAPFAAIYEAADIEEAFAGLTPPLLLKTASMGYDGKGQLPVNTPDEARVAFGKGAGTFGGAGTQHHWPDSHLSGRGQPPCQRYSRHHDGAVRRRPGNDSSRH